MRTLAGHTGEVLSAAFSPDGEWIVSGSNGDNLVKIWHAATGAEVRSQFCASYSRVESCWGDHPGFLSCFVL